MLKAEATAARSSATAVPSEGGNRKRRALFQDGQPGDGTLRVIVKNEMADEAGEQEDSDDDEVIITAVVSNKQQPRRVVAFASADAKAGFPYPRDTLVYLRWRETPSPPTRPPRPLTGGSPQVPSCRRHLVDWTCQVGEHLRLSPGAVHLAVRILDLYMEGNVVKTERLYLVCLVSIMLAAKMEEKDSSVPRTPTLNSFVDNRYPLSEFTRLETEVATYFGWNLNIPTAEHFVDLLFPYAFDGESDLLGGRPISDSGGADRARSALYAFVRHFADASLQDDALLPRLPSEVAAAVVYCARTALELTPRWPAVAREAACGRGPDEEGVAFCVRRMWTAYNVRVNECTPPRPKQRRTAAVWESGEVTIITPPPSAGASSSSAPSSSSSSHPSDNFELSGGVTLTLIPAAAASTPLRPTSDQACCITLS